MSLADETARGRPSQRAGLEASIEKLDSQITKGSENLLLLAPVDFPAASAMLGHWREQRNPLQVALDERTRLGIGTRIVPLLAGQSGFDAIAIRTPIRSGHQDRAVREDGVLLGTFLAPVADTSVNGHLSTSPTRDPRKDRKHDEGFNVDKPPSHHAAGSKMTISWQVQ